MGRKKIYIEKIDDNQKRMVAFTKRRQGLFKKVADVCIEQDDAMIVVVSFSRGGKAYSFAPQSPDVIIDRYLTERRTKPNRKRERNSTSDNHDIDMNVSNIASPSGGDCCCKLWLNNIDIDEIDSMNKLLSLETKLINLKKSVSNELDKFISPSPSSSSTEIDGSSGCSSIDMSTEAEDDHEEENDEGNHNLEASMYLGRDHGEIMKENQLPPLPPLLLNEFNPTGKITSMGQESDHYYNSFLATKSGYNPM